MSSTEKPLISLYPTETLFERIATATEWQQDAQVLLAKHGLEEARDEMHLAHLLMHLVNYKGEDVLKGIVNMTEGKIPVEETKIPSGTFMLIWFTNPEANPWAEGKVENGISTQFYSTLEAAEKHAEKLSGNRIILSGVQNAKPETNVFWQAVKIYGTSFDISTITVLS
jgi:hypothetical protein